MAASTSILDWLGKGTHAARPATPPISTGGIALYYETDTFNTFIWTGSAWSQLNGGGVSPGTPPLIVQSAIDNSGTASITLGSAPTNGNVLVAMCFNPSTDVAGTGYSRQVDNGSGLDYGTIMTKVAGVSESATQSPLNSSPGGTGLIAMWELSGQAIAYFVTGASQNELATPFNASAQVPTVTNMITLMACACDNSETIVAAYNFTQDQIVNTGNRRGVMGHAGPGIAGIGQLLTVFSGGTPSSKASICNITA